MKRLVLMVVSVIFVGGIGYSDISLGTNSGNGLFDAPGLATNASNSDVASYASDHSGEVVVLSGTSHAKSLGTTLISVDSLKGADGHDGAQGIAGTNGADGATGSQGVKGDTGNNGLDGANGTNGTDGVKGDKGDQGIQGVKGDLGFTGVQGVQGVTGLNGKDVDPVTVAKINNRLDNHDTRIGNLEQNDKAQADAINKLQQTKLLLEQDVRLWDGKRTTIAAFNSYDLNSGHGFAQGLRITVKAGTSYEERVLAKQQDTLKEIKYVSFELSKQVAQAKAELIRINNLSYSTVVIEKVVDQKGRVLKRRVISSGLHN